MLVASSVIFLGTVVLQMEGHLTLLVRPAINVVNLVTSLATAPRRLPMVTSLVKLSILVLPLWLHQFLLHRSLGSPLFDRPR